MSFFFYHSPPNNGHLSKKSLCSLTGYSGYIDELSNHTNTFNNSFAPVCILQIGAFSFPQNFFQKILKPIGINFSGGTGGHERGNHHPLLRLRKEVKP